MDWLGGVQSVMWMRSPGSLAVVMVVGGCRGRVPPAMAPPRTPEEPEPGRTGKSNEAERMLRWDCMEERPALMAALIPAAATAAAVAALPGREWPLVLLAGRPLSSVATAWPLLMTASLQPYSMLEMPPTSGCVLRRAVQ